jgi:tetratricopeptide (TPR) repeat protein
MLDPTDDNQLVATLQRTLDGVVEAQNKAILAQFSLDNKDGALVRFLGEIYLAQGLFAEALAAFKKESHEGFRLLGLSVAYHALGRKAQSSAALEQLSELPVHAFSIAKGYAYCGDVDQAFEWLERAYTQRNPGLSQVKLQPLLRNLHGDPRWKPFLKKMRLAD